MKAALLKHFGPPNRAFIFSEIPKPIPEAGDVLIEISAFGLNYADVMARKGIYGDAPPLPCVLGYECVGKISETGADVQGLEKGQRVLALTRFGAYAQFAKTDQRGIIPLSDDIPDSHALALATQYGTAWFASIEEAHIRPGDHVLIHAAAGGVGTALIQIAKWKGCKVYACAGSDAKLEYLKQQGADEVLNYRKHDFEKKLIYIRGKERFDVIFDPIGGANFRKNARLLAYGGRLVVFGASSRETKGIWPLLKLLFGFGLHLPVGLIMKSQSWVGINLLRIGDHKPQLLADTMKNVMSLYREGILKPHIAREFSFDRLEDAHALLESRNSMGKIVVKVQDL
jgi:NADPH2:quinone reductase